MTTMTTTTNDNNDKEDNNDKDGSKESRRDCLEWMIEGVFMGVIVVPDNVGGGGGAP